MKQYQDLTAGQKKVFEKVESIFVDNSIDVKNWVTVLGVIINKYKYGGKTKWKKQNK